MLFLDDQQIQNLINNTHKNLRLVYHHLNIRLSAEESAIDDVTHISELSSIISHQLQIKDLLFLFFLLMISFFFKLKTASIFSSTEVYFCENFICCWFCIWVMINALNKLEPFNFIFVNDHKKIFEYFNEQWNVCIACHQYNKTVNFKICHFSEVVSIYMQGVRHQCTRLSDFSHKIQWFINKQKLKNFSNLCSKREVCCNLCWLSQSFQKLKCCIDIDECFDNRGKRVRITWR